MSGGAVLFLRGNTPSVNNAVTGNITLTGGSLAKTDTGTWTVGALGKTISAPGLLVANGILKMGAANVLAPSPVVSMGNTTGGSTGSWDLNGFDQTIAGIIQNGTSGIKPITSSTGTPVLTVDNATDYTTGTLIPLTGALGLTKQGAGKLTLAAANTYTGPTIISAGTLLVNGSLAASSAVTVATNATLGGNGTVGGAVTNNAGGTLSPGTSIGTLTLSSNLTLNAGSTNTFEVDGSTPANDVVVLGGTVIYGGVLNIVTNGTFTAGQTFTLFSGADATNVSNFSSIAGSPGSGKVFSFTNGVLSVVATGPSGPATLTNSVSGGVLSLSWPAGQGWRLQAQTNALTVGLYTNWVDAADSSVSSTNYPINRTNPTVFYRLIYTNP
ncbi:MAG: autotransporter-associated beta strand repeat-containing protein [Verrucomicrobia bacterium]|jgi:autotransporter-associated beta strand protein|nr:autotransporter-associated beta strand repeat-containing protein [Verrucomicrobiota bacterium]